MKRSFLAIHKIIAITIASFSAAIVTLGPALADPNQPFSSLESDRNSNPLSGNSSDFNMFNLIHQAQMGTIQWNAEEQNQQLDQAATAFKAAQQKRLQSQPKQNPSASEMPLKTLPSSDK
jgi:alpha-mannosidase